MKPLKPAPLLLLIALMLSTPSLVAPFSGLCDLGSILTNPLVLSGAGYAIYKSGDSKQKKDMRELKLKKREAWTAFSSKKNQLEDFLGRLSNEIDLLNDAVNYMESRLPSNANSLRASIEVFTKNDVPAADRMRILRKAMRGSNRPSNFVRFGTRSSKIVVKKKEKDDKEETTDDKTETENEIETNTDESDNGIKRKRRRRHRHRRQLGTSPILNKQKKHRKGVSGYNLS